eukprot:2689297-Amphidinium_carterae.1
MKDIDETLRDTRRLTPTPGSKRIIARSLPDGVHAVLDGEELGPTCPLLKRRRRRHVMPSQRKPGITPTLISTAYGTLITEGLSLRVL